MLGDRTWLRIRSPWPATTSAVACRQNQSESISLSSCPPRYDTRSSLVTQTWALGFSAQETCQRAVTTSQPTSPSGPRLGLALLPNTPTADRVASSHPSRVRPSSPLLQYLYEDPFHLWDRLGALGLACTGHGACFSLRWGAELVFCLF
jgi:hypothetical protein